MSVSLHTATAGTKLPVPCRVNAPSPTWSTRPPSPGRTRGPPPRTSVGLASQFKSRWQSHKTSFTHERYRNSTKLSNYVWSLRDQNVPYTISWDIMGRASTYNPANNKCRLCLLEKFFILYHPEKAQLNQRSELFSKCLHKKKFFLYE